MMDEGKKNGNSQAFLDEGPYSRGLTKREYFAAMAMQGLCCRVPDGQAKLIAMWSVEQADDLLAELAKTEVGG